MNREQQACADYARLTAEIKRLTKAIGTSMDKCAGLKGKRDEGFDFVSGAKTYQDNEEDHSHLKHVFTPDIEEDSPYVRAYAYMSENQIREYLIEEAKCPHCLTAYEAVMARKATKRELGIVKRRIVAYGKSAMKESA